MVKPFTNKRHFFSRSILALAFGAIAVCCPAFEETSSEALTTRAHDQNFISGSASFKKLAQELSEKFPRETLSESARRRGISLADQGEPQVGDQTSFYLDKKSNGNKRRYPAILRVIGKHCYVFLEKGKNIDDAKLKRVAKIFDEKIYPQTTAAFGSEWKPGIDGDPRITLFLVGGMDGCDGFFYPGDAYTADKYPTSNEREMLYLSIGRMESLEDFMGHLVAHELQHMIHWNHDPNETYWVEEGLSEYAATLFGQMPWTAEQFFQFPDRNLLDWEDTKESENYGHVFLFTDFLLHRPGISDTARARLIREMVKNKKAGVAGVSEALQKVVPKIQFDDVFRDFSAAAFINNSYRGDHPWRFSPFVMKKLEKYATREVSPRRSFKSLNGSARGKVSMWASAGYSFAAASRPASVNLTFNGSIVKTKYGNNSFMLGLVLRDSTRRNLPQVIWLRTNAGKANHKVRLPSGNYDEILLLVVNRGPSRFNEADGRLPKADFEFSLSADNSEIRRFESLHNSPAR